MDQNESMIAGLLFAAVTSFTSVEVATDDIWVYPHASDPATDVFLRAWGNSDGPVAGVEDGAASYSLVKFKTVDGAGPIKSATLILWLAPNPVYGADEVANTPLQARLARGDFSESAWSDAVEKRVRPYGHPDHVLGFGAPMKIVENEPSEVKIDLLKGPADFRAAYDRARTAGSIGLAITTSLSPDGRQGYSYKLHSRHAGEVLAPKLVIEFETKETR